MTRENTGFINHLKTTQPATWGLLQQAGLEGLIIIDEPGDAITPTNRLLLTYPGLHKALCCIINDYAESVQHSFLKKDLK